MKKIKIFESFAGYGSQRLALRNIGIDHETLYISEIDLYALKLYKSIHGDCPNLGDIRNINQNDLSDFDLLTYSFPCQDISNAGSMKGLTENSLTRSSLLWECRKIINHKKPKYLLMENVKNLISFKFLPDFNKWIEYLESIGYKNYYKVLNSKNFGVPQSRNRVFMVSILGDHTPFEFPEEKVYELSINDILDDSLLHDHKSLDRLITLTRDSDIKTIGFIPTIGKTKMHQSNMIYDSSGISPTLTANDYKSPLRIKINNFSYRKLNTKEYFRLMGLNDNDISLIENSGVSKTQQYKLAGNSIVVNVLEEIFKKMFNI